MTMTTKELRKIESLSEKAFKAAKVATKISFEVDTLLSLYEAKMDKVTRYKNAKDMFKKLGIPL